MATIIVVVTSSAMRTLKDGDFFFRGHFLINQKIIKERAKHLSAIGTLKVLLSILASLKNST